MGHYVWNFLAKSGDEHGDDNDKSKKDYDYGDACERMNDASSDAWEAPLKPRPPTYAPPMTMMQAITQHIPSVLETWAVYVPIAHGPARVQILGPAWRRAWR